RRRPAGRPRHERRAVRADRADPPIRRARAGDSRSQPPALRSCGLCLHRRRCARRTGAAWRGERARGTEHLRRHLAGDAVRRDQGKRLRQRGRERGPRRLPDHQVRQRGAGVSATGDSVRPEPSKLQRKLIGQIAEYIRDNGLEAGAPLTELGLAEALNVSRTPVRAALEHLTGLGVVAPGGPRRGFQVTASPEALAELTEETAHSDEEEDLYVKVAADYVSSHLPEQFSEADMMRQYGVTRGLLLRVLRRMSS